MSLTRESQRCQWLVFLLIVGGIVQETLSLQVQFLDVWGSVTFRGGDAAVDQDVGCIVEGTDHNGEFVWLLDGEVLRNNNPVIKEGDLEFSQILTIRPDESMHGKNLVCRYVEDFDEAEDVIEIRIDVHELPASPFTPKGSPFKDGEAAVLSAVLKLFPRPEPEHVTWVIETQGEDGEVKDSIKLVPGEKDNQGRYEADLERQDGNKYFANLIVGNMDDEETKKNFYLDVTTGNEEVNRIVVNFDVASKKTDPVVTGRPDMIETTTITNATAGDANQQNPATASLGVGIWIILAIIILIIIVCISYCCYQKYRKDEPSGRPEYAKAATSEPPA